MTKCNETHTCCNERLEKEGGKAKCCYCSPHEGCELTAESRHGERPYLTNLEKIRKAWAMGWSAEFSQDMCPVRECIGEVIAIDIDEGKVIGRTIAHTFPLDCKKIKIIGYKYAGELAGNTIPEGQKFKVKKTGKIVSTQEKKLVALMDVSENENDEYFDTVCPSDIEPYFN